MGIGLPIEIITWGSMLSLSDKALMTGSWWIILIPGIFLIATVLLLDQYRKMPSENRQTEKKVISDTGPCCSPIICHGKCQIVLFFLVEWVKIVYAILKEEVIMYRKKKFYKS